MESVENIENYLLKGSNVKWEKVRTMTCKGICNRHRAKERSGGRYANGQKRCQVCQIFIKWDGLRCPCCKSKLRLKSRNSAFKKGFAVVKKYQPPKNKIQASIPMSH